MRIDRTGWLCLGIATFSFAAYGGPLDSLTGLFKSDKSGKPEAGRRPEEARTDFDMRTGGEDVSAPSRRPAKKARPEKPSNEKRESAAADRAADAEPSSTEVGSTLEAEYKRVIEREQVESRRLSEYREKKRELDEVIREFEDRHALTLKRKERLQSLMAALEGDPAALDAARSAEGPAGEGEDLRTCAPGVWTPSADGNDRPAEAKENGFQPEVEKDYGRVAGVKAQSAAAPALAAPPGVGDVWADPVAAAPAPAPVAAAPLEIRSRILASDGRGADAVAIIGAGGQQGVQKGMLFQSGEGSSRTVLVVTEVYPSYARAQVHPHYAAGEAQVDAPVIQVSRLP